MWRYHHVGTSVRVDTPMAVVLAWPRRPAGPDRGRRGDYGGGQGTDRRRRRVRSRRGSALELGEGLPVTSSVRMGRALVTAVLVATTTASVFGFSVPTAYAAGTAGVVHGDQAHLAARTAPSPQAPEPSRPPGLPKPPGCLSETDESGPDVGLLRLQADLRRPAPQLSPSCTASSQCREATASGAQSAWCYAERLVGGGHHGHGRLCRPERLSGGVSRRDEDLQGAHPRSHRQAGAVRVECRQVLRTSDHTTHQ